MGRRSRYVIKDIDEKKWKVGAYLRVSADDNMPNKESSSISSQRQIVEDYLKNDKDMEIYNYYIDDGYSGTNFNRPSVQSLLKDVLNKKINAIIVKDLSRFGRNYIEVGNYLEQIFPLYKLRFIAIDDNIDSYKDPSSIGNMANSFKNLMNDEYARDISNKIRNAVKIRQLSGTHVCGKAIYGYKYNEGNDKLIIVEDEAEVVRKIYDLCIQGFGAMRIARYLNDNNIPSPKRKREGTDSLWGTTQIKRILENQKYIGDTINGKYGVNNYKDKKEYLKSKDEWIIIKNTHEAIISKDIFEKAQKAIERRNKEYSTEPKNKENIYVGLLKCSDCKKSMRRYVYKTGKIYYSCKQTMILSKSNCGSHFISEKELNKLVLKAIQLQISLILDLEKVINRLIKEKKDNSIKSPKSIINNISNEIKNLNDNKKINYENWKANYIEKEEYLKLNENYNNKIKLLNIKLNELNNEGNTINYLKNNSWIEEFKKYKNIKELSRECVVALIKEIYVYKNKNIKIIFNYMDEYEETIKMIEKIKEGENNE